MICSIDSAIDPTNRMTFLLDWEITKLCNLDCSYCGPESHNNSTQHPPLERCLETVSFMFKYVDAYMQHKKVKDVILNVYGGESLFHPNIVEILEAVKREYKQYSERWRLTTTCTTNGVVGQNLLGRILPYIDEFTVSFHAESLEKQRQQALDNLLAIQRSGTRVKCVVMMHNNPALWEHSLSAIDFCKSNDIAYIAKALDNSEPQWAYQPAQQEYMKVHWMVDASLIGKPVIEQGRACCGGRKLSVNNNLRERQKFVPRTDFAGWQCSVNWFFLYIDQLNEEIYTNKDCRTALSGKVEPLGTLANSQHILDTLNNLLHTNTMPIVQCVKPTCRCGFCAPKAQDSEQFLSIAKRHFDISVLSSMDRMPCFELGDVGSIPAGPAKLL